MKNIVVPTDFSDNANNALKYAINLAVRFDSKIHLIHVYDVPNQTGMLVSIRDFMKKDAEEGLAKIVNEYKDHFIKGSSLEAKSIEGYADQTIYRYAKRNGADLIVMGTQGASGVKGIFLGSNTSKVIQNSEVPVLAIPKDCSYQKINNITFAIDNKIITNDDVLKPLIALAKDNSAHVSILHVEKDLVASGVDEGVDIFLSDLPHSFNTVYNDNVKEGIDGFVDRIDSNLLCMIHRERGWLGNLFHRSTVTKEAFDSPLPLLVLFDKY